MGIIKEIIQQRQLLYSLICRDIKEQYHNTFLGLLWPLIQLFVTVLIMGVVVQFGLRMNPASGFSYIVWLIPAQAAWSFFSESTNKVNTSLLSYTYLIKKINFNSELIPVIKIVSTMFTHSMFLVIVVGVFLCNHVFPSMYWLQICYYVVATGVFLLGFGWLFSSIAVFFRDTIHVISTGIGFLMWLTPLFWNIQEATGWLQVVGYINPVTYITEGYRRTFLYHVPFWVDPVWTIYFWSVVIVFLLLGLFVFRKLKPHFADVL